MELEIFIFLTFFGEKSNLAKTMFPSCDLTGRLILVPK